MSETSSNPSIIHTDLSPNSNLSSNVVTTNGSQTDKLKKPSSIKPPSLQELAMATMRANPEKWAQFKQEESARSQSKSPPNTHSVIPTSSPSSPPEISSSTTTATVDSSSSRLRLPQAALQRTHSGSSGGSTGLAAGDKQLEEGSNGRGASEGEKRRKAMPSLDQIRLKYAKGHESDGKVKKDEAEEKEKEKVIEEVVESSKEEAEEPEDLEVGSLKVSTAEEDSKSDVLEEGEIPEASSPQLSNSSDSVPESKIHPLQHTWTLSFDSRRTLTQATQEANTATNNPSSSKDPGFKPANIYANAVQTIGEFNTVEMFCRYFNHTKKPSQLEESTNIHFFKDNIRPMWEDSPNSEGGRWVLSIMNRDPTILDRYWEYLVFALVGEMLDENDEVTGAIVSVKRNRSRIQLWTRQKKDVEKLNSLGKRMMKILEIEEDPGIQLDYQAHQGTLDPAISQKLLNINTTSAFSPMSNPSVVRSRNEVGSMGPPSVPGREGGRPTSMGGLGFGSFNSSNLGESGKIKFPDRRGSPSIEAMSGDRWRDRNSGNQSLLRYGSSSNLSSLGGGGGGTAFGGFGEGGGLSRSSSRRGDSRSGSRAASPDRAGY